MISRDYVCIQHSARSDASNTLSNRDIDIVSWIGYYFRRFHRLRSRSRRRDTCPPVDITDRTRKATAVFDTVLLTRRRIRLLCLIPITDIGSFACSGYGWMSGSARHWFQTRGNSSID